MKRRMARLAILALSLAVSACNTAGPRAIESGVVAYNQAVAQTKSEQLLLNLVRLRYRDTTSFLEISSISSQYQLSSGAGVSFGLKSPGGDRAYGGSASFGYSEKPTVSFNPVRGEAFVRQVLSPIAPGTISLMVHSGWNLDRVARLMIQGLNGVGNATNASSPTPSMEPEYEEFVRVASLLKVLQRRNQLELGAGDDDGHLELRLTDEAAASAEMKEIAEILSLPTGRTMFTLVPTILHAPDGMIGVNMRSLSGVLYFLSTGVDVPAAHEQEGLVTVTKTRSGDRFDWQDVSGNLLHIRTSSGRPSKASVKVEYRGHWFYIADNDLNSKSTFSLLSQLTALQAGGVPSSGPILTLPIG